jgi:short subunit dehydrogenase-like uncharacterized protein
MPKLDLVVFGASGFTGQLVCKYLRRNAPAGLRWALAGRDAAKLEAVAEACDSQPDLVGGEPPVEVISGCGADADGASRICGNARAVISTAGPFVKFSDALVGTCARSGVSYVDINGEVPWVRRVLARDDGAARDSSALIVPNCGFDSVPSDLGAMRATALLARATGGSPCVRVDAFMHMAGAMSGGTIETGLVMEERFPDEVGQPFLLGGGEQLARGLGDPSDADVVEAEYSAAVRRCGRARPGIRTRCSRHACFICAGGSRRS